MKARLAPNCHLQITSLLVVIAAVAMFISGAVTSGRSDAASTANDSLTRSPKRSPRAVKAATNALTSAPLLPPPPPTNRYVKADGFCGGNSPCYTTIQLAINAATAGDTIIVYAGT